MHYAGVRRDRSVKTFGAYAALFVALCIPARAMAQTNCFVGPAANCVDVGPHPLPTSVAAFEGLQERLMAADTPQQKAMGGAALFAIAAMVRTYDEVLGKALLVLALDPSARAPSAKGGPGAWSKANDYYIQRLAQRKGLVGSYAVGTVPDRDYAIDPGKPVTVRFRRQTKFVSDPKSGKTKVFVCTPGAKTCRPMQMARDATGIWRVTGFSSFTIGF